MLSWSVSLDVALKDPVVIFREVSMHNDLATDLRLLNAVVEQRVASRLLEVALPLQVARLVLLVHEHLSVLAVLKVDF